MKTATQRRKTERKKNTGLGTMPSLPRRMRRHLRRQTSGWTDIEKRAWRIKEQLERAHRRKSKAHKRTSNKK